MEAVLEQELRYRIGQQLSLEAVRDVGALYELIDPAIRQDLERQYSFERDLTLGKIREFVDTIHSVNLIKVDVEGFTLDGGSSRGHRPTAIVVVVVEYNDAKTQVTFRTPWVHDSGTWFTCAVGKI